MPFGEPSTFGSPFMFTGEMMDDNGLGYLRARYYNPTLGMFPSLDPVEVSNRYQYAYGNPVNMSDPSGLCPESLTAEGDACEFMASVLRGWGVYPVWDVNAPASCTDETIYQLLPMRQRWTLEEMKAIYDAFDIFGQAHQALQIPYNWPLGKPIRIEKRESVGNGASLGESDYSNRLIIMGAATWGCRKQTTWLNAQYRAWLVLHEFSHIFTKDRLIGSKWKGVEIVGPNDAQGRPGNSDFYVDQFIPQAMITAGFDFSRGTITGYPEDENNIKEALIEAVTATLWNYGFGEGFDESAGGRTAPFGIVTPGEPYSNIQVTNVRCFTSQGRSLEQLVDEYNRRETVNPAEEWTAELTGISLEQWILENIILQRYLDPNEVKTCPIDYSTYSPK